MGGSICAFTDHGRCFNCGDCSYVYRHEEPIRNEHGEFCEMECAVDYADRADKAKRERETEYCSECSYDRHEHAPNCTLQRRVNGHHCTRT